MFYMKKIISSWLILLSIMSLLVVSSFAQKQRLGIRPQKITLDGEKYTSVNVEAYCFDRHILIDKPTDYSYLHTDESAVRVFVGAQEYTLPAAINAGKIKIIGRPGKTGEPDLIIEIVKLVPDKVIVVIENVSVFRDVPGVYLNRSALNVLNSADSSQNRQSIQDNIWVADINRSRLQSLGYKSIEEFQQKFGLPVSKYFDPQTAAKLEVEENALIRRFEQNYLGVTRSDTKVKSVADNIERLGQKYEGKEAPGLISGVSPLFEKYLREHVTVIRELGKSSSESGSYVLRVEPLYGSENLYTFYSPFGVFRLKDTKELTEVLTAWSEKGREIYVYLAGFTPEKAEGLKTSMNINAINLLKNDSIRGRFFSLGTVAEVVSDSPVTKIGNEYSSTLVYKVVEVTTAQKMTVRAKLRNTVSKFVQSFKGLVNGKRSLPSIAGQARKASGGSVKLEFGELGEIEIIKLFRKNSSELNIE
jgi:hypothetical protein